MSHHSNNKKEKCFRKLWSRISHDFNLSNVPAQVFFCSEWELQASPTTKSSSVSNPEEYSEIPSGEILPCKVSTKYLVYRGVFMIVLLSALTVATSCHSHLFYIFLTNWSFTVQNLYGVVFFLSVLWRWWTLNWRGESGKCTAASSSSLLSLNKQYCATNGGDNHQIVLNVLEDPSSRKTGERGGGTIVCDLTPESPPSPLSSKLLTPIWTEKVLWVLINIVHVLPYIVVAGYWCVVYKYDPDQPFCEKFRSHYIYHGATAVLAFVDTIVIAIPARISHLMIPTGLLLLYVTFTFFYELAGGPYRAGKTFIYSVLDWKNKPSKALLYSTGAVIIIPLAHVIFCYGIYKLRMRMKRMLSPKEGHRTEQ